MRGNLRSACAAFAAALACAGAVHAQGHAPMFAATRADGARSLTGEQKQERQFLREAAGQLRFVQAASKLALDKSGNGHVRSVAAAMLEQANVMQPEALYLLHVRGMALPMPTPEETRVLAQLKKSSGPAFDRAFIDQVAIRANQLDAARFERIAGVTHNPQLLAWVERHLPTLRYHVAMASKTSGANPTTAMGAGPSPAMTTRAAPRAAMPKV